MSLSSRTEGAFDTTVASNLYRENDFNFVKYGKCVVKSVIVFLNVVNLDNMAYARLKNAVITYNIPSSVFGNIGISRASVFFAGNNLFLIYAAQKNFDPEIGAPMTYPAVKTFAIGVKATF